MDSLSTKCLPSCSAGTRLHGESSLPPPQTNVDMPYSDVDEEQVRLNSPKKKQKRYKKPVLRRPMVGLLHDAAAMYPVDYNDDVSGDCQDDSTGEEEVDGSGSRALSKLAAADATVNPVLLDSDDEDGDPDGETKIDTNGYLLGGRSYICPVFRSPCRPNPSRLYINASECSRYAGFVSSNVLLKKFPQMKRIQLTQAERTMLCDNLLISAKKVTSKTVYMFTARSVFKTFGALIVKNGRNVADDYCEANSRWRDSQGPPRAPDVVVADMAKYQLAKANYIKGALPPAIHPNRVYARVPKGKRRWDEVDPEPFFPVVATWVELMPHLAKWESRRKAYIKSARFGLDHGAPAIQESAKPPIASDCSSDSDLDAGQ
ncbi:chromatin structure-remodeling complex subunit RSC7 [Coemansia thaxteri]|uniref:Chromatin structure-remodeling complex subunit RSC7 n=1 Tax=Coemansia thaxteri TaxID=2663907 RepID=A0A9W8BAZ2_9FUNG|nr:chromatin structure-remodeling complex subunit RSC7 [Coemansia thaxteri]